jgi:hypothetical protein
MIRLVIMVQLLAACGGTIPMGVQRKVPPNWGRSYPMQNTAPTGPDVELVRLELDESRDVTLYLNDGSNTLSYPNLNEMHIRFGNGGTARELSVFPSVLGSVIHVVASSVFVHAYNYSASAPTNELGSLRVSAMAGLGRPSETTRRLYNDANSNNQVAAASNRDFILDPWTFAAQISVQLLAGAVVGSVTVTELNRSPLGDTPLVAAEPIANYSFFKTLHPYCNVLRVSNANAAAVYADVSEALRL